MLLVHSKISDFTKFRVVNCQFCGFLRLYGSEQFFTFQLFSFASLLKDYDYSSDLYWIIPEVCIENKFFIRSLAFEIFRMLSQGILMLHYSYNMHYFATCFLAGPKNLKGKLRQSLSKGSKFECTTDLEQPLAQYHLKPQYSSHYHACQPCTTVSYAKTLHTNILIYQCSALQQVIRSKSCESCYWHFFSL